ncbi:hypothetical protein C0J52_12642 [Blattella germanica]|nr:hypothetical protein C0J52_12642 [Blattella germanica]
MLQISGCVFLVAGIWIIVDVTKTHLFDLTSTDVVSPNLVQYLAYFLMTIGCVIILVGFFGCCGSLYERRFVLITLTVAVATLVYREQFLNGLETRLMNRFRDQYGKNSNTVTQAVDQVQFKFNCCGILSDDDYLYTRWRNDSVGISNRSKINVPLTCCILANSDVSNAGGSPTSVVSRFFTGTVEESWQHPQPKDETSCQDPETEKHRHSRHKKGCLEDVEYWFKEDTTILIGLGIGLATFQVSIKLIHFCFLIDIL